MTGTSEDLMLNDDFGAIQLHSLDELYESQKAAVRSIIERIYLIAYSSLEERRSRQSTGFPQELQGDHRASGGGYTNARCTEEQAFSQEISSGPTMLRRGYERGRRTALQLLTPERRLKARIGSDPNDFHRPHNFFTVDGARGTGKTSVLLTLIPYLEALDLGKEGPVIRSAAPSVVRELRALSLPAPPRAYGTLPVALVLPIVFTEDMETQETTMEAVFALMMHELEDVLTRVEADRDARASLIELRRILTSDVGLGWTYSRKIGAEALPNDALDYQDFVNKRGEVIRAAYTRVPTWRRFIDLYLETLGYETLVLLFDDSDLNAHMAEDMIRSLQMYLSHPRVACVVAVEIKTLEQTLLNRNLEFHKILQSPIAAGLNSPLADVVSNTLEQEKGNTSARLSKVLPIPNRFRLDLSRLAHMDTLFRDEDRDQSRSFRKFCKQRFETSAAEERIGWWFINGPYRRIVASNLRTLTAFRRLVRSPGISVLQAALRAADPGDLATRYAERLDELQDVIDEADSHLIDDEESNIDEDTEEEKHFVDLWIDVKIASSTLDMDRLLSAAAWITRESTYYIERSSEAGKGVMLLGVASSLPDRLVPRNCLYMCQLRRLENVLASDLTEASQFVAELSSLVDIELDQDDLARAARRMIEPPTARQAHTALLKDTVTRAFTLRSSDPPRRKKELVSRSLVALLVAAFAGASESSRVNPLRVTLQMLVKELSNSDSKRFSTFAAELSEAIGRAERHRQEALFLWACVNGVAAAGDDNDYLEQRPIGPDLARWATPSQRPGGPSTPTRFQTLVQNSAALVSGPKEYSPRHGLLLAWSLVPLLQIFHDYGSDYDRPVSPGSWDTVIKIFDLALAPFSKKEQLPELGWLFPDLNKDAFARIIEEVQETSQSLKTGDLSINKAAGSVSVDRFWGSSPARRLAALLGTSERWAEGVLNGIQP